MPTKNSISALPRIISSEVLLPRSIPGEPVVVVQMRCASTAPFQFSGRTNKQYRFAWNRNTHTHELRCPASWWNGPEGVGRDLTDQLRVNPPLVVQVETPAWLPLKDALAAPISEPYRVMVDAPAVEGAQPEEDHHAESFSGKGAPPPRVPYQPKPEKLHRGPGRPRKHPVLA